MAWSTFAAGTLLVPQSALEGESGFLAANLYAKSIFGEDALVNVSVEQREGGGSCFRFTLPLADVAATPSLTAPAS